MVDSKVANEYQNLTAYADRNFELSIRPKYIYFLLIIEVFRGPSVYFDVWSFSNYRVNIVIKLNLKNQEILFMCEHKNYNDIICW